LPRPDDSRQLEATYGQLPTTFIENKGQEDDRAKFYLRSRNQTLWITNDGVVFDLLRAPAPQTPVVSPEGRRVRQRRAPPERLVFTQQFLNSNRRVTIEPRQLLPGTHNYYLGKDPSHWRPGIRGWGEVLYRDIWTGVDLRLYGNGRHLEQEFIVRPGGDPSRIRVAYRGIEGLRIAEDGALVIRTAFGELKESAPTIYQEIDGKRVAVDGYLRFPSSFKGEQSVVLRLQRGADLTGSKIGVQTRVGTQANQMALPPTRYTNRDLNVYLADGQAIGIGEKVRVSGKVYFPAVDQDFPCGLENPLIERAK